MRTIKFRGRDFAGLWYIGDLVHNNDEDDDLLIRQGCLSTYIENETAGQFTGITDKNGKDIYEGDIIRSYDSENNPIIHSISWDNKKACYVATMLQYPLLGGSIDKGWIDEFKKEVIGNVFDNLELMEGGEE